MFELPGKLGDANKCLFVELLQTAQDSRTLAIKLYGEKESKKMRSVVSTRLSTLKTKGWMDSKAGIWFLTDHGKHIAENLHTIGTFNERASGPKLKYKKKPLKDIQPIQQDKEANLSGKAMDLVGTIGEVLDENQAYRDFITAFLHKGAEFLNLKIIDPNEEISNETSD